MAAPKKPVARTTWKPAKAAGMTGKAYGKAVSTAAKAKGGVGGGVTQKRINS